jgi:hypothetical protein
MVLTEVQHPETTEFSQASCAKYRTEEVDRFDKEDVSFEERKRSRGILAFS